METVAPPHDCGMCDAPLRFDGMVDGVPTFVCTHPDCDWWHIATDCCDERGSA